LESWNSGGNTRQCSAKRSPEDDNARERALGDALIYSEKPFLPKAKPSKINPLDSRLRGNDDFFSVCLGKRGFIQKNRFRQKQNPAKSTHWIPDFAGMTIFSAYA